MAVKNRVSQLKVITWHKKCPGGDIFLLSGFNRGYEVCQIYAILENMQNLYSHDQDVLMCTDKILLKRKGS